MGSRVKNWTRSNCVICGRSFPHKVDYQPKTCGHNDCLHEASKRGLLCQPQNIVGFRGK